MKLLMFQAKRFRFRTFEKTLEQVPDLDLERLAERLRGTGYQVWITPFGYVCEWDLSVYGESLAKVFKAL